MDRRYQLVCGLILLLLLGAAAENIRCGRSVEFQLSEVHHCLTTSGAAVALIRRTSDQELKVLKLVPEQKLELGVQGKDAVLNLTSFFPVCYVLSVGQCVQTIGEGSHQRNIRNAPRIVSPTKDNPAHHRVMFVWAVASLLVLLPLATASFLCCTTKETGSKPVKNRRMSKNKRNKIIAASTDVSINITDIDNPLGVDSVTTFQKSNEGEKEKMSFDNPQPLNKEPISQSVPNLMESSLDVGTRDHNTSVKPGISLSSVISLGPRVPPEGSSLDNLYINDKPLKLIDMPPPPSVPPPSSHQRQYSTPVSLPTQLSPIQKPRPLTVVGQPSSEYSPIPMRLSGPLLRVNPITSPPLSPISLIIANRLSAEESDNDQTSVALSINPQLSHKPHCTQCKVRAVDSQVLAISDPETAAGGIMLCQQCQSSDPQYHELNESERESLTTPDPSLPDPVYERIGSIRRQHIISTRTNDDEKRSKKNSRSPFPSPIHSPNFGTNKTTCPLPPLDTRKFPQCPLPLEGSPLPPRPPTLGLVMKDSISDHNYERLPSTFGADSPEDILYAHIQTPPEDEDSGNQGQRAHMLKIDSQGYAEVVNNEREESSTPDALSSPTLPLSQASQAMASDYEVPVRIALPPSSPSLLQTSPSHIHPTPIPVPSPTAPFSNLDRVPPSLEGKDYLSSTGPSLRRQAAIAQNPLPLPARSFHMLPQQDKDSQENRRDSDGSTISYHLSYRLSTTSSGLGESMSESLRAIAEEEKEDGEESDKPSSTEPELIKQKIYEVENRENRSRTKSYPNRQTLPLDMASNKMKAQTMRVQISFNQDSQTV